MIGTCIHLTARICTRRRPLNAEHATFGTWIGRADQLPPNTSPLLPVNQCTTNSTYILFKLMFYTRNEHIASHASRLAFLANSVLPQNTSTCHPKANRLAGHSEEKFKGSVR